MNRVGFTVSRVKLGLLRITYNLCSGLVSTSISGLIPALPCDLRPALPYCPTKMFAVPELS